MATMRSVCGGAIAIAGLGAAVVPVGVSGASWAKDAAPPSSIQSTEESTPASRPASAADSFFGLDELSADLGLDAEYQRRQVITDGSGRRPFRFRQLNEQWRFEESVGVRGRGNLFGERVMRFDVGGRWGISQEGFFERRPGRDLRARPDGDVLEYDLHLDILPNGKISGALFGSQLDDRIPRRFLPSINRRRERYGGGVFFNDRTLPMRLTWEHVFDRLRSGSDGLLDDEDLLRETLQYEATWQPSEYHSLRFAYEYDQRREQYSGLDTRFNTVRNDLTLDHTLRFGSEHRHSLETLLRFQDETGDLARDTIEAAPRLRLRLSDALSLTLQGQYLRESFQQLLVEQYRGDVGLTHQWGDTLTGTISLYGLRQNTHERGRGPGGGADTIEWGTIANAAFNRDNALGRFSANVSYTHTRIRTADGRRAGIVIAEAVTFRDPRPVYLAQTDINRLSIVVTDPQRSRLFLEGRDYFVVQLGHYTAIERVRTGRIADRETVSVSYTHRTFDSFEISRDRIDVRIQQDFKFGLTPYYAGSIQDEDLDRSRFQTFRARNVNRHRIGATYRKPRWSIGLEYEFNDDAIDPFEAFHLNGDVMLLDRARQQLNSHLTLSRFLFDGSDGLREHDTTLLDLGMSYRYLLSRDLELNAAADYRYEDDSLFGRTKGVDLTGSLAYKIGLFSALFEVEYDVLDLPASSDNNVSFWLKLRRNIPIVASRKR